MKAFVATAGVVFGLITLAHLARLGVEGLHLLKQPVFLLTSIASVCIGVWAVALLRKKE